MSDEEIKALNRHSDLLERHTKALEQANNLEAYKISGKDPNELLTVKQVSKEYKIGVNTVRMKVFADPKLPVQRYLKEFVVTRFAMDMYVREHHDYLSERR